MSHISLITFRYLLISIRQLYLICQIQSFYGENWLHEPTLIVDLIFIHFTKTWTEPFFFFIITIPWFSATFWQDHMTLVVLLASWLLAAFLFSWHNMGWNILNFMRSYMHYLYLLYLWRSTGQGFFRYGCCRIPIKCVFLFLFFVCSMMLQSF